MLEEPSQRNDSLVGRIIAIFILVVGLWIATWVATWYFLQSNVERGAFGDMFGSVNALFSGLALAGIIIAIVLQKKELALQRKELEYSRSELKGQKEQLQAQNKTMEKQSFENTFFQMVRLHNDIVSGMFYGTGDSADRGIVGRNCFKTYIKRFEAHYNRALTKAKEPQDPLKIINHGYEGFFMELQAEVGHYFRNLYTVIKFVDMSDIENKKDYTNIVRAQLSSHELSLLFYNCLWRTGRTKFKALVENEPCMLDRAKRNPAKLMSS